MTENEEGRLSGKESRPSNYRPAEAQRLSHFTTAAAPEDDDVGHAGPSSAPPEPVSWDRLPLVMDALPVAALIGCSMNTLYELCRRSELPARRVGRQWRFSRDSLRRYIEGGAA